MGYYTDHHALRWVLSCSRTESHGRLERWRLRLLEFDFEVQYRPGATHHAADVMSRLLTEAEDTDPIDEEIPVLFTSPIRKGRLATDAELAPITRDEFLREQAVDAFCQTASTRGDGRFDFTDAGTDDLVVVDIATGDLIDRCDEHPTRRRRARQDASVAEADHHARDVCEGGAVHQTVESSHQVDPFEDHLVRRTLRLRPRRVEGQVLFEQSTEPLDPGRPRVASLEIVEDEAPQLPAERLHGPDHPEDGVRLGRITVPRG